MRIKFFHFVEMERRSGYMQIMAAGQGTHSDYKGRCSRSTRSIEEVTTEIRLYKWSRKRYGAIPLDGTKLMNKYDAF